MEELEGGTGVNTNPLDVLLEQVTSLTRGSKFPRSEFETLLRENALPAAEYRKLREALDELGIEIVDAIDGDQDSREGVDGTDQGGWHADGFGEFMRKTTHRVLTFEEEQALGMRIDAGRLAASALEEGAGIFDGRARRDFERRVADGKRAESELALHNIRLVVSIATELRQRTTPALEFEDLVQEGYVGLARAVAKWEYARGLKFSTYATWWIRQSLQRAVANRASTIRLPMHVRDDLRRIRTAEWTMKRKGKTVDDGEIARHCDLPVATVTRLRSMGRPTLSLDKLIGNRSVSVGDFVADDEFARPERVMEDRMVRHEILAVIAKLPERECEVLLRRYGLTPGQRAETLEQIGHRFGVTRERIRQIEKKALTRLREAHAGELRDFAESLMEV